MNAKIGHWAFVGGLLIAVVVGLVPRLATPTVTWILIVLGLIIGFLNVTEHETTSFLVATAALLLVGQATVIANLGVIVRAILDNLVAIAAPAALLVALRALYISAQD